MVSTPNVRGLFSLTSPYAGDSDVSMSPPPAPKRAKATAKAKPKSTKECCVYDATISAASVSASDLHSALRPICKKWTFQLE